MKISRQDTASAVRAFPNGTHMRLMECSDYRSRLPRFRERTSMSFPILSAVILA